MKKYEEMEKINEIKARLKSGLISYDNAFEESIPHIEKLNEKGKIIAKKHGRKFQPFTFSKLMR